MDMCYDGALAMPSSYAVMNEEEMTYVDGGGITTLKKNLTGLYYICQEYLARWKSGATIGQMFKNAGMTLEQIGLLAGSYWKLAGKIVSIILSVTKWLGAHAAAIGVVGTLAGAAILWNFRIFY